MAQGHAENVPAPSRIGFFSLLLMEFDSICFILVVPFLYIADFRKRWKKTF